MIASVRLEMNGDGFTSRMHRAAEAAGNLNRRLELDHATWEPHDWSDDRFS